jgi:hypothetical protein
MDFGQLIGDSFDYTKEGLVGNWGKWILLIVLAMLPAIPIVGWVIVTVAGTMMGTPNFTLLFGGMAVAIIAAIILGAFYSGYQVKILRGDEPLPEVTGFGTLFTDGLKYMIIQFVYMIPVVIVFAVTIGATLLPLVSEAAAGTLDPTPSPAMIGGLVAGMLVTVILAIVIALFAIIGAIRFTRTGKMGEAFNFGAVLATIGKIGWGTYILALIIMIAIAIAYGIVTSIISAIPVIGPIISFVVQIALTPAIAIFFARYLALVYDSAGSV